MCTESMGLVQEISLHDFEMAVLPKLTRHTLFNVYTSNYTQGIQEKHTNKLAGKNGGKITQTGSNGMQR